MGRVTEWLPGRQGARHAAGGQEVRLGRGCAGLLSVPTKRQLRGCCWPSAAEPIRHPSFFGLPPRTSAASRSSPAGRPREPGREGRPGGHRLRKGQGRPVWERAAAATAAGRAGQRRTMAEAAPAPVRAARASSAARPVGSARLGL